MSEKRTLTEEEKNEIRRQQRMKKIQERSGKSFESIISTINTPKSSQIPTSETPLFEVRTPILNSSKEFKEIDLPNIEKTLNEPIIEVEKKIEQNEEKNVSPIKKDVKEDQKIDKDKIEVVKPFNESQITPKSTVSNFKTVDLIRQTKTIVLIVLSILLFFKVSFMNAKPFQIFFTVETIFGIYLFLHFASGMVRKLN